MIYVHIPFCDIYCYYCNFVSCNDQSFIQEYFIALEKEIISRKNNKEVVSIFLGGGSPSVVDTSFIKQVLNLINQNFVVSKNCETTIELNPEHISEKRLLEYKAMDINRLSFRVQSLSEEKLDVLGIHQTKQKVLGSLKLAKSLGFSSLSADLMIGLEKQESKELYEDIIHLIETGVQHFSLYMLIVEEGSNLEEIVRQNQVVFPSDEEVIAMYEDAYNFLSKQEFERYEISNFAKNQNISCHNLGYWQMREYLGFGAGAHSFSDLKRQSNSQDIKKYIKGEDIQTETVSEEDFVEQALLLGLATKFGVNKALIPSQSNLKVLIEENFVEVKQENVILKEHAFGSLNEIVLKLLGWE